MGVLDEKGKHLYIAQMSHTGAVKIGRSRDPEARLRQLQTSCPYPLKLVLVLRDQGHLEKKLHRRLRRGRTKGGEEWFEYECLGELPDDIYWAIVNLTDDWWKP